MTERERKDLDLLEEAKLIPNAEKNLRSKIDSILRSLENLTSKKARIEFEIKKQKKALYGRRMELKKVSTSTRKRLTVALESGNLDYLSFEEQDILELQRLDSRLLEESNRALEQE